MSSGDKFIQSLFTVISAKHGEQIFVQLVQSECCQHVILIVESCRLNSCFGRNTESSLQISLQKALDEVIAEDSINDGLAMLQNLLEDYKFTVLYDLIEEMKHWDTLTTIPEPKSFLFNAKLQPQLSRMLENSFRYRPYLECFIPRFDAVNEVIQSQVILSERLIKTSISCRKSAPT